MHSFKYSITLALSGLDLNIRLQVNMYILVYTDVIEIC